jgi:hypothetical protein
MLEAFKLFQYLIKLRHDCTLHLFVLQIITLTTEYKINSKLYL